MTTTDDHPARPPARLRMPPSVDRLHRRLEDAATTAGLLDVAYRTIDSPVGTLLLATTEAGHGPGRLRT